MKLYRTCVLTLNDLAVDRFVVPPIQREYVWSPEDARYLIETMAIGLPIGSVVLQRLRFDRAPRDPWNSYAVIDGQQRISTLIGATLQSEDPTHEICIDRNGAIVIGAGKGRVPVSMMADAVDGYSALMVALVGFDPRTVDSCMQEYRDARKSTEITRASIRPMSQAFDNIRAAEIPALIFEPEVTSDQIADSFRRTNVGGVPMGASEIEALLSR